MRYRKLERRERRASQSASWTAALEALCCDASSTCADCAAAFTAEKRLPRGPPGPLKLTVARASELPAADFHRWNFNEAFLGKWQRFRRGVLTGSVLCHAGDAAVLTVCGASAMRASVYGDGDQSETETAR